MGTFHVIINTFILTTSFDLPMSGICEESCDVCGKRFTRPFKNIVSHVSNKIELFLTPDYNIIFDVIGNMLLSPILLFAILIIDFIQTAAVKNVSSCPNCR